MYKVGEKYRCAWAEWVQILHIKKNGELVMIDNNENVSIKHPKDYIFDQDGFMIKVEELMDECLEGRCFC